MKVKVSTLVMYAILCSQGVFMGLHGWDVTTYQWWAITILTCAYGIAMRESEK